MDKKNHKTLMMMISEYLTYNTIILCVIGLIFFLKLGSMMNVLMSFLFIVALLGFILVMNREAYDDKDEYVDAVVITGFFLGIVACYFMSAFIAREFAGVQSITNEAFIDSLTYLVWSILSVSSGVLSLMDWLES